jgi:hypothetical protein
MSFKCMTLLALLSPSTRPLLGGVGSKMVYARRQAVLLPSPDSMTSPLGYPTARDARQNTSTRAQRGDLPHHSDIEPRQPGVWRPANHREYLRNATSCMHFPFQTFWSIDLHQGTFRKLQHMTGHFTCDGVRGPSDRGGSPCPPSCA